MIIIMMMFYAGGFLNYWWNIMESNQIWYVNRTVAELFSAPWCCCHLPIPRSFWHWTCYRFFLFPSAPKVPATSSPLFFHILPHGLNASLLLVKVILFSKVFTSSKWSRKAKTGEEAIKDPFKYRWKGNKMGTEFNQLIKFYSAWLCLADWHSISINSWNSALCCSYFPQNYHRLWRVCCCLGTLLHLSFWKFCLPVAPSPPNNKVG